MRLKISEKAKRVISTVAPALGAALGGPLGGLAGNVVAAALGDKDVEQALTEQAPETLLALRQAEAAFVLQLEELGIERERIEMADRVSARELAKTDLRPQLWISALFLAGYFGITILRMSGALEIRAEDAQDMGTLWGVLTTGVPIILSFWFGSTAGSALKSNLLAQSRPAD